MEGGRHGRLDLGHGRATVSNLSVLLLNPPSPLPPSLPLLTSSYDPFHSSLPPSLPLSLPPSLCIGSDACARAALPNNGRWSHGSCPW